MPVEEILAGNLSEVRGAHVIGSIPLQEHVINRELKNSARGAIREIDIRVGENNRIQAGVRVSIGPFSKWFRPELLLDPQGLWGGSPGVLFTISAAHYGAIARLLEIFARGSLPPGVQVGNNRVAVDLGAMPQAPPYRHLFRHIKRLQLTTRAGVIWADFELRVDE